MGFVSHAVKKVFSGVGKVVGAVTGGLLGSSRKSSTVTVESSASSPAVAAPDPVVGQETNAETDKASLRKKRAGKKGLMISTNGTGGGGGTTSTGLNI